MLAARSTQSQLPDEILLNVFGNLGLQDIVRASAVCRTWRNVAASNALWQRTCRQLWRVWDNLPDFEGAIVSLEETDVQWKNFCRWRVESERTARHLVASMVWPLKLPGCLRTVVTMGNLVVEELERMEAMGGDLGEGTRFYAGLALERIHRSNCLRAIQALVSGPTEELEDQLATGALLIAKLRYPDLDIEAINSRLDDIANVLHRRLNQDAELQRHGGVSTPAGALIGLKLLNSHLFRPSVNDAPQGHSDADNPDDECLNLEGSRETFYPPDRLYIHEVLDSRKGVDLSLGIIHSAIGQRCGIPVRMVAIPMIFMAKVGNEGEAEERFVNMSTGTILQRDQCLDLILMMGAPYDPALLAPVPPSSLLVALCDNLIAMYRQGSEASGRQMLKWRKQMILPLLDAVLLINPNDCAHRFSRAKALLEMTDFEGAIQDLQELLQRADGRGAGGDGQEGIPSALLQQFLQRAVERQEIHAAWCSKQRSPRPAHVHFKIGHTMKHRRLLYTGVIFGWDTECSADEEWISTMKVDQLQFGRNQPFYRVLPNQRNRSAGSSDDLGPTATYVPQENILEAPGAGPIAHEEIGMHFLGYRDGKYVPNEYLCQIYPEDVQEPNMTKGIVEVESGRDDDVSHTVIQKKASASDVARTDRPETSGSFAHSTYDSEVSTNVAVIAPVSADRRAPHVLGEDVGHSDTVALQSTGKDRARDSSLQHFAAGTGLSGVQTFAPTLQLSSVVDATDSADGAENLSATRSREETQDLVTTSQSGG